MKKTIYTALASVILATLLSLAYFYFNRDPYAIIGYAFFLVLYLIFQLIIAFAITNKDISNGLKLGAGIILLIGFGLCSSAPLFH